MNRFSIKWRNQLIIVAIFCLLLPSMLYLFGDGTKRMFERNLLLPYELFDFSVFQDESYALTVWTNFSINQSFVSQYCRHKLKIDAWAPGKSAIFCGASRAEDIGVSWAVEAAGNWETDFQKTLFGQIFPKFPQAAFIDIGGQLGVFSISAAKLERQTFTFEPEERTFEFLRHSIALNNLTDLVHLYKYGLMDSNYCATIFQPTGRAAMGEAKVIKDAECSNNTNKISIGTLDQMIPVFARLGLHEAIIKMDIEGSEAKAILGGLQFLRRVDVPVIQMETDKLQGFLLFGPEDEKNAVNRFLAEMKSLGYKPAAMADISKVVKINEIRKWPHDILWYKNRNQLLF